jgi:hypothetical protein
MTSDAEEETHNLYSYSVWDLTFYRKSVETDWIATRAKHSFSMDARLCQVKLVITIFMLVMIALHFLPASGTGICFWLGYLSVIVAQSCLLTYCRHACIKYREQIVLTLKLPFSLLLMGLIPTFVLEPISSVAGLLKGLFMGSGLVAINCTGG